MHLCVCVSVQAPRVHVWVCMHLCVCAGSACACVGMRALESHNLDPLAASGLQR